VVEVEEVEVEITTLVIMEEEGEEEPLLDKPFLLVLYLQV